MVATTLTREQIDALARLNLSNEELEALLELNDYIDFTPALHNPSFREWAEAHFYIPTSPPHPIVLAPHQPIILEAALDPANNFTTIIYSCPKKSGKTAIAGAVARYKAETVGPRGQIYCMANDLRQATGRIYQAAIDSIELDPHYDRAHKVLMTPNGPAWHILRNRAVYLPTRSTIEAVPLDFRGEAGSNPDISLWSELWGFTTESHRKMWAELTNVPTKFSQRWVETYAGFSGESDILESLWNLATNPNDGARQLTVEDLEWPYASTDGTIPVYVNRQAGIFAYIDQGAAARRMPWQTPDYYQQQAILLTQEEFDRLHSNMWVSAKSSFIPEQWFHACYDNAVVPLQAYDSTLTLDQQPPIPPGQALNPYHHSTIVIGVDASVTGDCTALVGVARHHERKDHISIVFYNVWYPTPDSPMDYANTVEAAIRWYTRNYKIVQVAYDPYQLHYLATNLMKDFIVWCRPFSQLGERMQADKQLYDLIRDRYLHHGYTRCALHEHVGAASKVQSPKENTKLRIVKKSESAKIDLVVALSMAVKECLHLELVNT